MVCMLLRMVTDGRVHMVCMLLRMVTDGREESPVYSRVFLENTTSAVLLVFLISF
jgi:hypothetical protein